MTDATVTVFCLPSRSAPVIGLQVGMALAQISAQRYGIWLAALLLLQAQQTFSISHQIFNDVDCPILSIFDQTLIVRTVEARRCSSVPKVGVNC